MFLSLVENPKPLGQVYSPSFLFLIERRTHFLALWALYMGPFNSLRDSAEMQYSPVDVSRKAEPRSELLYFRRANHLAVKTSTK